MLSRLLFDRVVSEKHTAAVRFSKNRCLRSRFNRNECRSCLEECESGALALDGRLVVFDQQKCTGCMRCLPACPNDVFDAGVDVKHLLDTLRGLDQTVVLTCGKNAHRQQWITVPCVVCLSEPLLAAMNSVAGKNVIIDLSHCSDCNSNYCLSSFHEKIRNLTTKLTENGRIPLKYIIKKNSVHPADNKSTRRSFLRFAKKSLIDFGRETVRARQTDTIPSSNHAGKMPVMNSVALQYAYKNSSANAKRTLLSYFHTVRATERCDLCPGCQGMCPTGALKRIDVDGEKRLMFTSSACSGCGLCQEFCRKGALEVIRGFSGDPGEQLCIR